MTPGEAGCPGCRNRIGSPRVDEGGRPPLSQLGIEPLEGYDFPPGHPPDRRHARHACRTVHEHSAAAALALGAAPVLDGPAAQRLAKRVEQRQLISLDLHTLAIEAKGDHGRRARRPLIGPIS